MEDDFNFETMVPEKPSRNRTFWFILIGLLGIVIVSIIGILLWVNVFSPRQQEISATEATETAAALAEMALAQVPTTINTAWPSNTPSPTSTQAATRTAAPPAQASTSTPTIQPSITPTPTALPMTGFADEIGLPGLVSLGFTLVVIAIVARRIRAGMAN